MTFTLTTPNPVEEFESLVARSEAFDRTKEDFRIAAKDLSFDYDAKLIVKAPALPYDDGEYYKRRMHFDSLPKVERAVSLTDAALGHLHSKLGPAHWGTGSNRSLPGEYLGLLPPYLRADILNWTLERSKGMWKVRLDGQTCRAFVDGSYPRIWNTEVLRQLSRVLRERNGLDGLQFDTPHITPDEFFLKLWWDGAGTGNYRVGAQFGNNEVGNGSFVGHPMIRRGTCSNSIVVSDISALTGQQAGFKMVHYVGASAEAMMTQFYAQLPALMNASAALVNKMIEAESVVLPDFRTLLDGLKVEHGWSSEFVEVVDRGTEGQRTLAGLVNGVTYAAHAAPGLNPAEVLELETMGGNFLVAKPSTFTRLVTIGRTGKRS